MFVCAGMLSIARRDAFSHEGCQATSLAANLIGGLNGRLGGSASTRSTVAETRLIGNSNDGGAWTACPAENVDGIGEVSDDSVI